MTRSSSLVERPVLRLLLLALMGLALASRLALGATLPVISAEDGAKAGDPLAELQAAMIMCHTVHGHGPSPTMPRSPQLNDLLLFDQADNTHALPGDSGLALHLALRWSAVALVAVHAVSRPPLWPATQQARGPPSTAI